ncbi:spermidine/putrescine transport system ATP-binding protein [Clostridium sp. USBA 49]|uniref:ABC transporter ATP-binding protein n=1 Tax=Clostridium TaxID=1485 RepID=UPI0009998B8F|nr:MULTISPECIES: polyamine ABC transporter ATP-binding protein [Clostridium]SKA72922.1 spermidine/putrescine transport system ATP-binding protein [Clostridium sp. USBA 49]
MTEVAFIQLANVCKKFDGSENPVIKDLSLNIKKGEFLTLLGPSGCGKTTTLRMIAGFEQPTNGKIIIDGEDITNKSPHERCVNTVFQNYALFPHMNIFDNIAFGLKMKKVHKDEIKERVFEMLHMIQLDGYEKRMPSQLSGGQMQRVAIARAVINRPKVLLLDEPLGALDLKLRKAMQIELKHLQKRLGITFIFVTHDQEEALTMSDRIVVMKEGVIEQLGTPDEIYERPITRFVADFIGDTNILEGKVKDIKSNEAILQIGSEENTVRVLNKNLYMGQDICVALRPERIKIKSVPEEDDVYLKGKLKDRIYTGISYKTIIELSNGKEIIVNEPISEKNNLIKNNNLVFLTWKLEESVVMEG